MCARPCVHHANLAVRGSTMKLERCRTGRYVSPYWFVSFIGTVLACLASACLQPSIGDRLRTEGESVELDRSVRELRALVDRLELIRDVKREEWVLVGSTTPIAVDAGWSHTLAVDAGGLVWAWGSNGSGLLGDGVNQNRSRPVIVPGVAQIEQVSAAEFHSLARDRMGGVWAWGNNDNGQIGDGTQETRNVPVRSSGLPDAAIGIVGGWYRSFAVLRNGELWAWGNNDSGTLGDGTQNDAYRPVRVLGLTNVVAVSAGKEHTLALLKTGEVWAWGRNSNGSLGFTDPGISDSVESMPRRVSSASGAVAMAAGWAHSLVLLQDGTVAAWGRNNMGQLGDGTLTDRSTPVQVSGLSNVKAIAAGAEYSLALKGDGSVWAWGHNFFGQLGRGARSDTSRTPVRVDGLQNVAAISAGVWHAAALERDCGLIWTWGTNDEGQLGDGRNHETFIHGDYSPRPVPASLGNGVFGSVFPPGGPAASVCRVVRVSKSGNGRGGVTSTPSGILCDENCVEAYGRFTGNTSIRLSANPASGSRFAGWDAACKASGTAVTAMILVDRSLQCTASFVAAVLP